MAYRGYFSMPGRAPRVPPAQTFQAPTMPHFTRPGAPPADIAARMRPSTRTQEANLLNRISTISQRYQPRRTMQTAQTRASLAGFGGYQVNDDGSIQMDTDPGKGAGQFYKDAYRSNRDAANAAGMLDSSFAAKSIGAAFGRLSAEAQSVVTQHAASMNQMVAEEANEYDELNSTLLQLYGSEAEYLIQNPPAPPVPPQPPAAPPAPAGGAPAARRWTGSAPPNKQTLARAWGVPVSKIGVGRAKDGTYVAAIKRS